MSTRLTIMLALCALFAACATPSSDPDVYSRKQTRQPYSTFYGEVTAVRRVTIEGEPSWLGGWGGYILGAQVGGEVTHSGVGAAVGGIAGAVAGQAVEKSATQETGLEIQVRLDNADVLTVVQSDAIKFAPGDRVKILRRGNNEARVQRPY
ncbi:MAG: glycine zipper domain-containing protein [Gammaproteobacteria bacterium]|nr:glycine zipper domain-containing protein [Gammaproteobacteria bacterium]